MLASLFFIFSFIILTSFLVFENSWLENKTENPFSLQDDEKIHQFEMISKYPMSHSNLSPIGPWLDPNWTMTWPLLTLTRPWLDPDWNLTGLQLDPNWTLTGPQLDPNWTPNRTPNRTPQLWHDPDMTLMWPWHDTDMTHMTYYPFFIGHSVL